jgi:hypothetical protein
MAEDTWYSNTISFINKTDVLDETGKIKIEIIPPSAIGTQITVSPTPPSNPQEGQLWIDTSV